MSLFDKNNIDAPEFLNMKFFEDALRNGFEDSNLKINKVKFTRGHTPGENFCSLIYLADITYSKTNSKSKTIAVLIKTQEIENPFDFINFFGIEIDMYEIAIPKIESSLKGVKIAPKTYFTTKTLPQTILFQNMTPLGFVIADRTKGLDEEHCAMVLRKLAQYHAGSMDLAVKHPEVLKKFNKNMITEESRSTMAPMNDNFINDLIKLVKTWPGYETIANKLTIVRKDLYSRIMEANAPVDNEIKVLNHNDLWVNNILFQYENDKLKDLLLIDFQCSLYISPGVDLTHFLYTSVQYPLLEKKRDYLIEEYYYKTFKATLEAIGYSPIPTLADICEEIKKREFTGFVWALIKLYLICVDKNASLENTGDNIIDMDHGTRIRAIGMSTERYQLTMKYILKRIDEIGLLG